jgi:hypothetical protein
MILKKATSEEPGGSAGFGIVALLAVDQELAEFHPRVDVPVPSQKMLVAAAATGTNAQVKNAIRTRSLRSQKHCIMTSLARFREAGTNLSRAPF